MDIIPPTCGLTPQPNADAHNVCIEVLAESEESGLTSMSFPMPPEGELRRESRPTTGKAPCICLAIPLIACMGPLHSLSSQEV